MSDIVDGGRDPGEGILESKEANAAIFCGIVGVGIMVCYFVYMRRRRRMERERAALAAQQQQQRQQEQQPPQGSFNKTAPAAAPHYDGPSLTPEPRLVRSMTPPRP
jgi:flagellar biosynthesis/type III secretory pathway M-ring protein FliF/YscJ